LRSQVIRVKVTMHYDWIIIQIDCLDLMEVLG